MARLLSIAAAVLLVAASSCAASSSQPQNQSTAGHVVSTTSGSKGSVYFVSDRVGWVITIPPDSLRTVIYRTGDGGATWQLWGIAPVAYGLLGVGAAEVVLTPGSCTSQCEPGLLRSSDGTHWSFLPTPTGDTPFFLPDLRHGWIFGFVPEAPCSTCIPAAKGGPPGPPPPSALWATVDGGVTWSLVMKGNFGDSGGTVQFWSPTDGLLAQRPGGGTAQTLLVTHDGGASWHPLTFAFSLPLSAQAFVADSQLVMFDRSNGLIALHAADYHPQTTLYVSRTTDGGTTWSVPQPMDGCTRCTGQLFFLDGRRWMAYDKSLFLSADAGATWRAATPTVKASDISLFEVMRTVPGTVIALEPGVLASMTTDWGAHWRAVGLPQIYKSYRGLNGGGGWPWCCI